FLADLALKRPFGKVGVRLARGSALDAGKGNPRLHGRRLLRDGWWAGARDLEPKLDQGSEGVEPMEPHFASARAVNRTCMCLMPDWKFDCSRSTGPSSSMSASRPRSSSKKTRISSRPRNAPRQKCGPTPNARWSFGERPTSNVEGSGNT